MSILFRSIACIASGNACAQPWSVTAIAVCPHCFARCISCFIGVMPSIVDILVCMCSSTRLCSLWSIRTFFVLLRIPVGSMTVSFM